MSGKFVFDIKIDFEKSHGAYVWDKNSQSEFLDFFSMFSSLPLGYNHGIFDKSFEKKILAISKIRMANNLYQSDELLDFINHFRQYIISDYTHFTCTGALAVEAAIKCAMEYKKADKPMVLALKRGFHGINSWGFITDRYLGTGDRIIYFPKNDWQNLEVDELKTFLKTQDSRNIVAVVVEPIQCTAGDIYINAADLLELEDLCRKKDICFIVDEIQTGFGSTGKMWYSDRIGLKPDVLIFGKKAQICGIVTTEKYSECIKSPLRKLEVTFDGELIDAVRADYILRAYEKFDLINQANRNNERFKSIFHDKTLNYRSVGHLIAFDFESRQVRDEFIAKCLANRFLCNPTGEKSVRIRPNMAVTPSEIDHLEQIMREIL